MTSQTSKPDALHPTKNASAPSPSTSTEADTIPDSTTTDSSSLFPLEYVTALKAENIRRVTEGKA